MNLLYSEEIREQLVRELQSTKSSVHIISAYCKISGVEFIQENTNPSVGDKKLLVRFSFDDIVAGASDLEIYEFCKNNGWKLYVRFDLHAKTYIFDNLRCVLGSANLTGRGLGLHGKNNLEIACLAELDQIQAKKIDTLFDSAVLMTDELYDQMCKEVANRTIKDIRPEDDWSALILSQFKRKVDVLFTDDFPKCCGVSEIEEGSLDFLGMSPGWTVVQIKKAFVKSNVYIWLVEQLENTEKKEFYFGALSAAIHNAIINDPKPYRKEVKELQANLLMWIEELEIEQIKIDRPNHSQRIRLV